jgi:hypothetical protein
MIPALPTRVTSNPIEPTSAFPIFCISWIPFPVGGTWLYRAQGTDCDRRMRHGKALLGHRPVTG